MYEIRAFSVCLFLGGERYLTAERPAEPEPGRG